MRELDGGGRPGCLHFMRADLLAAGVVAHGLDAAGSPRDARETELVGLSRRRRLSRRSAVYEQLHRRRVGEHVHRLLGARGIRPVPDDVNLWLRVARNLERVVDLLGQTHRIDLATHATDASALLASVCIRVREVD